MTASSTLKSKSVPIKKIVVHDRLRTVDQDWVEVLSNSMEESGLKVPLICRQIGRSYEVVAGAHRLAAAKRLGWTNVDVLVEDLNDDQAALVEIDENLLRHELTVLDRAVALQRRKEIFEKLNPQSKRGGDRRSTEARENQNVNLTFWSDAAQRIGFSRSSIERLIRIASALDVTERSRLAGTKTADNQSELQALVKVPYDQRQRVIELLTRGESPATSVNAATAIVEGRKTENRSPADSQFIALMDAWSRANAKARRNFREYLAALASEEPE